MEQRVREDLLEGVAVFLGLLVFENEQVIYGRFQRFGYLVRQHQRRIVLAFFQVEYGFSSHAHFSR
jgi:hypothetical protein